MSDRSGFAIPELLVTAAILPMTLCVALVATSGLDESAGIAVSHSNLITLGSAHEMYAAEHDGKMFSLAPDDYGAYDGCIDYIQSGGCLDSVYLGWGPTGKDDCQCNSRWAYFIDHQGICQVGGSCGNAVLINPIDFANQIGLFRVPNCEQFNQYVNGRFYDSTFYAPLDTLTYAGAEPLLDICCTFDAPDNAIFFSSYSLSPSALWDPGVMRSNADGGFQAPASYDDSHRAPHVAEALHPELKSLFFEHNWNHGQPGAFNPLFFGESTPYYFNHGRDATPLTCFFDGSVRMLRTGNAADDDDRLRKQDPEDGLWHQGTPLGSDGYFSTASYDDVRVAHNVLTTDGIRGRDILSTRMRSTDTNQDGSVDGVDLKGVLSDWGVDNSWASVHDINADGLIDAIDLTFILGDWDD